MNFHEEGESVHQPKEQSTRVPLSLRPANEYCSWRENSVDLRGMGYARQCMSPRLSAVAEGVDSIGEVDLPRPNQYVPNSDVASAEDLRSSSSSSQVSASVAFTVGSLVSVGHRFLECQRVSQSVAGYSEGLQSSEKVSCLKESSLRVSRKSYLYSRSSTKRIDGDFCRKSLHF